MAFVLPYLKGGSAIFAMSKLDKPGSSFWYSYKYNSKFMNKEVALVYLPYLRKSSESDDKQALSIDSQRDESLKIITNENLQIAECGEISESHSAKRCGQREGFNRMLKLIEDKKANAILLWNVNRLSRNAGDTGMVIDLMDRGLLHEVKTPTQTFYNNPNDKFLLNLFCSQAKLENDNKGVDVKRGMAKKASMGWYPGPAMPGYRNTPDKEKGFKTIEVDEENFPLIQKMFHEVISCTHTARQVLNIATDDWGVRQANGKKITRSTWYKMLHQTFYYGEFEYSGKTYKGSHVPMITQEDFRKIQVILGNKLPDRKVSHSFPFTGVMTCGECGRTVTAEHKHKRQKNGIVRHYVYYHCVAPNKTICSQGVVNQDNIREQLAKETASIEIPEDFVKWSLSILKKENADIATSRSEVIKKQRKLYDECLEKIDNLIDLCADGTISSDDLKRRRKPLEAEKNHLHGIMTNTNKSVSSWLDEVEVRLATAHVAKSKFDAMEDDNAMKKLIRSFSSNLSLKDGKVTVSLANPLSEIKIASKILHDKKLVVRTSENRLVKRKNTPSYEVFPDLLRG